MAIGDVGREAPAMAASTSPDGSAWLHDVDARERELEPISDALFEHADLQPGEIVLDVGCGSGGTTARAAVLVAPEIGGRAPASEGGVRVVGNDVSASMIDTARRRFPWPAIEWIVADAQTHDFGAGTFDAVVSRFGVMFFADPRLGFANLAGATRDGGRLALAVWQPRSEVEFFTVPLTVALTTMDRLGVTHPPPIAAGTGPFSLGDPDRVRGLLSGTGWSQVQCHPDHRHLYVGGPGEPAHAVDVALRVGDLARVLEGQPAAVVADVREALIAEARSRHDGAGVRLGTALWIITATRTSVVGPS